MEGEETRESNGPRAPDVGQTSYWGLWVTPAQARQARQSEGDIVEGALAAIPEKHTHTGGLTGGRTGCNNTVTLGSDSLCRRHWKEECPREDLPSGWR
jgi:hypothetical protein